MLKTFAVALVYTVATAQEGGEEWAAFYEEEYGGRVQNYLDSSLCESGTVGYQGANDFSNLGQLMDNEYTQMAVHKIKSCEDDAGHWIGTQLTLKHNNGNEVLLNGLGDVSGKCQTLTLQGDIDAVKAGFKEDDEGDGAVKAIRFLKDGVTKTYGDLGTYDGSSFQFTSQNRFMGLHGSTQDGVVVGFSVISDMGPSGICPHKDQIRERLGQEAPPRPEPESEPESDGKSGPTEESKTGETSNQGGSGNNKKCDCKKNNGIDTVKKSGQKVIIYEDGEGNEYAYPQQYGTECIAWDETLAPYCADDNGRPLDDAPRWCSQPFCYVDKDCERDDVEYSSFFGDDYELWFSYGNCDGDDYKTEQDNWFDDEVDEVTETTEPAETKTGSGATSMALATAMIALTSLLAF